MASNQSGVFDAAMRAMTSQQRMLENTQRSFDNFLSQGAPGEIRKGLEAATGKLGSVADDLTGLDITGWSSSIMGTVSGIGSSFNKSLGGIATGWMSMLGGKGGSRGSDFDDDFSSGGGSDFTSQDLENMTKVLLGVNRDTTNIDRHLGGVLSGLIDNKDLESISQDIGELVEEGTTAGSIFTHDIYLEELLGKILKIDSDWWKEDLIDRKNKAKKGDEGEGGAGLGTIMDTFMKALSIGWMGSFGPAIAAFAALGPIILGISAIGAALLFFTDKEAQARLIAVFQDFSKFIMPILTDLFRVIVDALKEMGRPMIDLIENVMPYVKEFIQILANVLKNVIIPLFVKLSKSVVPTFESIFKIILKGLSVITEGLGEIIEAISPAIEQLFETFQWLMKELEPVFDELFRALKKIFKTIARIAGPIAKIYVVVIKKLLEGLKPIFEKLVRGFSYLIDVLGPIFDFIAELWEQAAEVLSGCSLSFTGIIEFLLKFNAFGVLFPTLMKKFDIITPLMEHVTEFFDKITGLFTGIKNWASNLRNSFDWFLAMAEESSKLKGWATPIMNLFDGIKSFAGFIGNVVLKPFKLLWRAIKPIIGFAKTFLRFARILGWPITLIMGVIDFVTGFIEGYEKGGIMEGLKQGLFSLVDGIIGAPLRMLGELLAWILEKLGLSDITKAFKSWVREILKDIPFGKTVLSFLGLDDESEAKKAEEDAKREKEKAERNSKKMSSSHKGTVDKEALSSLSVNSGAQIDSYNEQKNVADEIQARQDAMMKELEQKIQKEQGARMEELAKLQRESNMKQDQVVQNYSQTNTQQSTPIMIPTDPENMALVMRNNSMG